MANNRDNNIKWHAALTTFVNNVKAKFSGIETDYKAADTVALNAAKADATSKDTALHIKITGEQKIITDGKADKDLANVNVGAANSGKFLSVKADGGVEYVDVTTPQRIEINDFWTNDDKFEKYELYNIYITFNFADSDNIQNKTTLFLSNFNINQMNSIFTHEDAQFIGYVDKLTPDKLKMRSIDDANMSDEFTITKVEVSK